MTLDEYIGLMETLLFVALPVLALLTLFSWYQARRLWPYRLPVIIAIKNTVIGAAASWLAWSELYHDQVGEPPDWYPAVTATAVVLLCFVPLLSTAYLALLEMRGRHDR